MTIWQVTLFLLTKVEKTSRGQKSLRSISFTGCCFVWWERHTKHPIKNVKILGPKYIPLNSVTVHYYCSWNAEDSHISSLQISTLRQISNFAHALEETFNGSCKAVEWNLYSPALFLKCQCQTSRELCQKYACQILHQTV